MQFNPSALGLWIFLAAGAIALFSMIAVASWSAERRKEREAYYRLKAPGAASLSLRVRSMLYIMNQPPPLDQMAESTATTTVAVRSLPCRSRKVSTQTDVSTRTMPQLSQPLVIEPLVKVDSPGEFRQILLASNPNQLLECAMNQVFLALAKCLPEFQTARFG